jgi:hypothetical protein
MYRLLRFAPFLIASAALAQAVQPGLNTGQLTHGTPIPPALGGYAPGQYKGSWSSSASYSYENRVISGGHMWESLVPGSNSNTNVTPVAGATWADMGPVATTGGSATQSAGTVPYAAQVGDGAGNFGADGNTTINNGTVQSQRFVGKISPQINPLHKDFAGGADVTGANSSVAALNAAMAYGVYLSSANVPSPVVHVPCGTFKVDAPLINSTGSIGVSVEGESACTVFKVTTAMSSGTVMLLNGVSTGVPYTHLHLKDFTILGPGHGSGATLLGIENTQNLDISNVSLQNTAGICLNLQGASERLSVANIELDNCRRSMNLSGNTNEDYFDNVHVLSPGIDAGNFSWNVNAVNGVLPTSGTLYPDYNQAISVLNAQSVHWRGGSIKSTGNQGAFSFRGTNSFSIANIYEEDFNGAPTGINADLILDGPSVLTHLTSALTTSSLTATVDNAIYQPLYYGTASELSTGGYTWGYILQPVDYLKGSSAASSIGGGITRGTVEYVNVAGFYGSTTTAAGNLVITARGVLSPTGVSSSAVAWPATGTVLSIIHSSTFGNTVHNHWNGMNGVPSGYTDGGSPTSPALKSSFVAGGSTSNVQGEFIVGPVYDGYSGLRPIDSFSPDGWNPESYLTMDHDDTYFTTNTANDGTGTVVMGLNSSVEQNLGCPSIDGSTTPVASTYLSLYSNGNCRMSIVQYGSVGDTSSLPAGNAVYKDYGSGIVIDNVKRAASSDFATFNLYGGTTGKQFYGGYALRGIGNGSGSSIASGANFQITDYPLPPDFSFAINGTKLLEMSAAGLSLGGVIISGTPATGYQLIATGPTAATWQSPPTGTATFPSSGVVCGTGATTSTACSSAQITAALNASPTSTLSTSLIPVLNQNTTGTAGNSTQIGGITVTGTPASGYVITATGAGTATWQPPSSGTVATGSPLGKNVLSDFGPANLDNSGTVDNSANFRTILSNQSLGSPQLNVPAGTYLFRSSVVTSNHLLSINCEGNSGQNGGSGKGGYPSSTNFIGNPSSGVMDSILEIQSATPNSGSMNDGPRIVNCGFADASSGNTVRSLLKLTDIENPYLDNLQLGSAPGTAYTAGTVTLTNGSVTVTGTGTSWTASMAPGFLSYGGMNYEVISVESATSLTLADQWRAATVTSGTSGSTSGYELDSGGIGLWLNPGTATNGTYTFTQYGLVNNLKSHTVRYPVFASSGALDQTNSSQGSSRIKFTNGYHNCSLQNSIAYYFGVYSDTMGIYGTAQNNCTIGLYVAGGHSIGVWGMDNENYTGSNPTADGSTTCPAGNQSLTCTRAAVIMGGPLPQSADNNHLRDIYCNLCGDVVDVFAGFGVLTGIGSGTNPPRYTYISMPEAVSSTNTIVDWGSQADGKGTTIEAQTYTQSSNNVRVNVKALGSSLPTIPCGAGTANNIGSTFINSTGGAGTTVYICRGTSWVGIN